MLFESTGMGICDLYEHKNQFHVQLDVCNNFKMLWCTVADESEEVTVPEGTVPTNALKCHMTDCFNPAYINFDLLDDVTGEVCSTINDIPVPMCNDHLLKALDEMFLHYGDGE